MCARPIHRRRSSALLQNRFRKVSIVTVREYLYLLVVNVYFLVRFSYSVLGCYRKNIIIVVKLINISRQIEQLLSLMSRVMIVQIVSATLTCDDILVLDKVLWL